MTTKGHRFLLETAKRTKRSQRLFSQKNNDKEGTSFGELGQKYVNITEDTACVSYIILKVRANFSEERIELHCQ